MKYLAGFLTLIVAINFSLPPQAAFAASTSKVCCNGQCTTSDSSSVSVQDNNGDCQIKFGDDVQATSVPATPEPTEENMNGVTSTPAPTDKPTLAPVFPTASPEATITPDPTIMQMRKDINHQVEKQVQLLKEHLKNQNDALSAFFGTVQNFLQGLLK